MDINIECETGEMGGTSGTGENFELDTSCKLAPAVRLVGLVRVRAKASEGLELGMWDNLVVTS